MRRDEPPLIAQHTIPDGDPAVGAEEAGDQPQQRRLAAAGRAQDGGRRTGRNIEADPIEDWSPVVPPARSPVTVMALTRTTSSRLQDLMAEQQGQGAESRIMTTAYGAAAT